MKNAVMAAIVGMGFLLGTTVSAQDQPTKIELGINYSLLEFNPNIPNTTSQVLNGGGGSIVYFLSHSFGFKTDLQGYTNTNQDFVIPVGNTLLPRGGSLTVSGDMFTYMFGPEFKKRGRWEPYAQLLIGGAHSNVYGNLYKNALSINPLATTTATATTVSVAPDNNSFAMTVGFGLDVHINRRWSFRPLEVGYVLTKFGNPFGNTTQNSFRYVAGMNFNFD
jgi:hypothetical protein